MNEVHERLYETVMNYFYDQANLKDLEDALYEWSDEYEWEEIDRTREKSPSYRA